MADKDKYVNIADLKAKLRYWCKSRGASKQVKESLVETVKRIPYTVRSDISEALESENRWIPCSERMPKPNEFVLYVWRSKNGNVAVLHGWHFENRVENAWHQSGIGMSRPNEEVTHWMPLPEPPESEVQEDAET